MKRGRPKKAKEKQGRDSKINKKTPFLGGKQGFLLKAKKGKDNKTKTKKTKIRRVLGQVRWPFGRPLNPPKKNKNKKKQKRNKNKKRKNIKKNFQLSIHFFFLFWWVSKILFFDNLSQNARTPQNTIRTWVSDTFLRNNDVSRNGHFGPTQPKSGNSSYHFLSFFFSFNNQKHKNALKPLFYSVLAKSKNEICQTIISNTKN